MRYLGIEVDAALAIAEQVQAEVVRRIFKEFANGKSPGKSRWVSIARAWLARKLRDGALHQRQCGTRHGHPQQQTIHRPAGARDEAFDLIRSLIDEIRLVPDAGVLRIEIKGELAGIPESCQEGTKKKPGGLSTAGLAEQIKMVAGARNHRQLTLPPVAL